MFGSSKQWTQCVAKWLLCAWECVSFWATLRFLQVSRRLSADGQACGQSSQRCHPGVWRSKTEGQGWGQQMGHLRQPRQWDTEPMETEEGGRSPHKSPSQRQTHTFVGLRWSNGNASNVVKRLWIKHVSMASCLLLNTSTGLWFTSGAHSAFNWEHQQLSCCNN